MSADAPSSALPPSLDLSQAGAVADALSRLRCGLAERAAWASLADAAKRCPASPLAGLTSRESACVAAVSLAGDAAAAQAGLRMLRGSDAALGPALVFADDTAEKKARLWHSREAWLRTAFSPLLGGSAAASAAALLADGDVVVVTELSEVPAPKNGDRVLKLGSK